MKSPQLKNSAIVLGTDVNGIAVIRSLGRLGVRCGAIFSPTRGDHATRSRYLTFVQEVSHDSTDETISSAILGVANRIGDGPSVLIPTTDRFSAYLSRNREVLAKDLILCCSNIELYDAFLDKWKTAQLCNANGILIPRTACPQSAVELATVVNNISYPVVVKPRYTFGSRFPGKNAVFTDARSMQNFFDETDVLGHCVIQQIIPSGDGDILVVAGYSGSNGTVEAIYSGRKLRQYLPDYGATCFGISEHHPELEALSRNFLDNIHYQGFSALEFARSRKDGKNYFLELNTRTYYHNQLFADAGKDLTQIAYLSATGHDVVALHAAMKQRDGLIWLDFRRDFKSMRIKRRQRRITILRWMQSIIKARSFAYWDLHDPLPFAYACLWRSKELVLNLLSRLSSNKSDLFRP